MSNKKGMAAGLIALVVGLVIGVILLVGVLVPITADTVADQNFTGTNATIANNLTTFILVGVLVLVAKQQTGAFHREMNRIIPENNWKAEMLIRPEVYALA